MIPAIAILGNDLDAGLKHAFQDLAAALQLRAEFTTGATPPGIAGMVCLGALPENPPAVPIFQYVSSSPPPPHEAAGTLEFTGHPALPEVLRGRKLALGKESGWGFLDEKQRGETLAIINGRPVWKITEARGVRVWSVSTALPRLGANERLAHCLNGETFLPLLPLFLFLRALSPESRWQAPPLRACLVVDDPNLHAQTYGHIRYQALVRLAREQPFHAAMATVPFDGWWASAGAAKIFRENPRALSLLVHGNDHLHHELARSFQPGGREALVSQSLSRIESLERKRNVRVDRVMAPPHGVCAPEMFSALGHGGYEGVTTNRWSLWKHNQPEQLPLNFGLHPADWLGGLPVLNRFRFKSSIDAGEVLLAAVLGQPVIPYGHHQDFADDMIHVRRALKIVNSLPVRWMSLREILETNYEHRLDSGTLQLRLFSRRVKLKLPPGVSSVQIEPNPFQTEKSPGFEIAWDGKRIEIQANNPAADLPAGTELEITALTSGPVAGQVSQAVRKSASVGLRRLASEIRDRLKI